MNEKAKNEHVRFVHGYQCMFCGEIYETEDEAEVCWQRHIQYELVPVYVGSEEYPVEIQVRKIEGDIYVEIATYEMKKKETVNLPVKEVKEREQRD